MPSPPPNAPGGIIRLEYRSDHFGERHTVTMHLCAWFDPTPVSSSYATNDYAYIDGGPITTTELTVGETFRNLAALLAPYYGPTWTISCIDLRINDGDTFTCVNVPDFTTYPGTADDDGTSCRGLRRIRLLGRKGATRRLWLNQVADEEHIQQDIEVSSHAGGRDARDQAWIEYLSGETGGACGLPDGTYAFPVTTMQVWWSRALEVPPDTGGGGGGGSESPDIIVSNDDLPIDGPEDPTRPAIYIMPGLAASFAWWPDIEQWVDAGYNSETLPNFGTPVLSDSSPPSVDPGLPRLPTHPITQIWIDQSVTPPQLNYSDDGGGTWTPVGAVPVVANDAPGVIAYNDSGTWTAISADDTTSDLAAGDIVLSLSNDNPPKWSTFRTSTIITPADMANTPPPPPVSENCVQVRCSVAEQCTGHLSSLNQNWAHWLGPLLTVVGTAAFAVVLANVIDPLFDVAAEGALASYSAIWTTLRPFVVTLTSSITGGFLPALTSDQTEAIQKALFCILTCDGSVVNVTQEQINAWRTAINGLDIYVPGTLTQQLLDGLLEFSPLQDWQVQAQQASTSSTCDDWSCE